MNETPVMSPKTLIESVRVSHPIEQIIIRGRVGQIRPYNKANPPVVYADLELENSRIQITCPQSCSPSEGDNIIFSGILRVTEMKGQAGCLKMMVKGEPVGRWMPSEFGDAKVRPERNHSIVSLKKLIESNGPQSLRIIGSRRAIQDLKTEMGKQCQLDDLIDSVDCAVENKDELLREFRSAVALPKCKAVLFTRGGADGTIGDVWDDHKFVKALLDEQFPFFTAIGHSDVITLAEKLADKALATPTAAGSELGHIISELEEVRLAKHERETAISERDDERQKVTTIEKELKRGKAKSMMLTVFLILSVLALIGSIVVIALIK